MSVHLEWLERAACRDQDPELFFPLNSEGGNAAQARAAKRVCNHCPVIAECHRHAMTHEVAYGIWGGLTERERQKLRRCRSRPPRPVALA